MKTKQTPFAERIEGVRKAAGLNQTRFAQAIGTTFSTYQRWITDSSSGVDAPEFARAMLDLIEELSVNHGINAVQLLEELRQKRLGK